MSGGFVYIIPEGNDGPTKVGITKNLPEAGRLQELQTGNSRRLSVYAKRRVSNMRFVEKEVHRRLSRKRLQGEWFSVSPAEATATLDDVLAGQMPRWRRSPLSLWNGLHTPLALLIFGAVIWFWWNFGEGYLFQEIALRLDWSTLGRNAIIAVGVVLVWKFFRSGTNRKRR